MTITTFSKLHEVSSFYSGGSIVYTADYIISANGEFIHLTPTRISQETKKLKKRVLEVDDEMITCMAVQNNTLVVSTRSLQLSVYDMESFELLHRFRSYVQAPVVSMALHSSTFLLAIGSADGMVRVFDLRSKSCTHVFRTSSLVSALNFFDNAGNWAVCAGCEDGRLYVWDLMDKTVKLSVATHTTVLRAISFSGWKMLTAGRDSVVCFWDMKSILQADGAKQPLNTLAVFEPVEYAGFLNDKEDVIEDDIFYTAGEKGLLKLWSLRKMSNIASYPTEDCSRVLHPIIHAVLDKKSTSILLVDAHQNITVLDVPSLKPIEMKVGTLDEITDMKFLGPNGRWLAIGSTNENVILLDLGLSKDKNAAEKFLSVDNITLLPGHKSTILSIDTDYSLANETGDSVYLFASGSKDNSAKLWMICLSGDGKTVIKHVADFIGHVDEVTCISLSHSPLKRKTAPSSLREAMEGRFMITASADRTIKRWDFSHILPDIKNDFDDELKVAKSTWTVKAHEKSINAVHISHSNKLIATSSQDRLAKVWNMDGELKGTIKGHKRGIWTVRFSPSDKYIVTGSSDKTIKLWNPSDYTCIRTYESHTNSVLRVEFIPSSFNDGDGKNQTMVSTGSDGLTKIWCVSSTNCVQTLDNHDDKIWALAIRDSLSSAENENNMEENSNEEVNKEFEINNPAISEKCLIATGAGDSKVVISLDITRETLIKLQTEENLKITQDQELSNMIVCKDYKGSFKMALQLSRSIKIAEILNTILFEVERTKGVIFEKEVDEEIRQLTDDNLVKMLGYLRDWNTQAKWTRVSQGCLNLILKSKAPTKILGLPGIKDLMDAIIPYSERHFGRFDEMQTSSYLFDYVLSEMSVLSSMDTDTEVFRNREIEEEEPFR